MAFVKRVISLTFTLNSGAFQGTGSDTLTISGLRTSVVYAESGGVSRGSCIIRVNGLTASQMNSLSLYGMPGNTQFNNHVSVSAGDAVSGMSLLFQGTITACEADYTDQENAALVVEAYAYQYQALAPAQPSSYPGSADVSVIMRNLANQLNMNFENTGVSVKLSNPYFSGSLVDQVKACARAANINWFLDSKSNKLAIWPKGQGRNAQMVAIGPDTGMIGYPTFTYLAVKFLTVFNPNISYACPIRLTSSLKAACGVFVPSDIETHLSSETPDGPWFQRISATVPGTFSLKPSGLP